MKAILVIDIPKTCLDCPVCSLDEMDGDYICGKTGKCVEEYFDKKPSWCPLRPLPKRNEYRADTKYENMDKYSTGYADGRNDCLDEILGDYITQEEADLCGVQFWHDD